DGGRPVGAVSGDGVDGLHPLPGDPVADAADAAEPGGGAAGHVGGRTDGRPGGVGGQLLVAAAPADVDAGRGGVGAVGAAEEAPLRLLASKAPAQFEP